MIVQQSKPVTLIGGAAVNNKGLDRVLALAPGIVAADGGADTALLHGLIPDAVIGDFDSISESARQVIPADQLHSIPEQDSTDFDKCLRNIRAPLIIGVGFSGARLDHQLAAFNTLVCHPDRRCILVGEQDLAFLCPPSLKLDVPPETPLSLFPMGAVEGISEGLRWPIAGLNFAPDGRVGTSNMTTGPVFLNVTAPKMLVILPLSSLECVAAALQDTAAVWT